MSWTITSIQQYPAVIGEPFGGGYFAGYISHTADGNPTHALIVAPRATGATGTGYTQTTMLKWADETVAVPAHNVLIGANSEFDGKSNTDLMMGLIGSGTYSIGAFPAAQFCADLTIDGFNDWYLPARYESNIIYFHLKPTTAGNVTTYGSNPYAVPPRVANWSTGVPSQTYLADFQSGGSEAYVAERHWNSGEIIATNASRASFLDGPDNASLIKSTAWRVRAMRRIAL